MKLSPSSEKCVLLDRNGKSMSSSKFKEAEIEDWYSHANVPSLDEGFSELRIETWDLHCTLPPFSNPVGKRKQKSQFLFSFSFFFGPNSNNQTTTGVAAGMSGHCQFRS
jgi:hypothetical protein